MLSTYMPQALLLLSLLNASATGSIVQRQTTNTTDPTWPYPFPRCVATAYGSHPPICRPIDGHDVHADGTLHVTWDPTYFNDSTTTITLSLAGAAANVFETAYGIPVANGIGLFALNDTILHGKSALDLNISMAAVGGVVEVISGPWVRLVPSRAELAARARRRKLGVEVGVPVGVVCGLALLGLGIYYYMRKKGVSPLAMFSRNKGYGERQSFGQRVAGGPKIPKSPPVGTGELGVPIGAVLRRGSAQVEAGEGLELEQRHRPGFARHGTGFDAANPFDDKVGGNAYKEEMVKQQKGDY